MLLISNRRFIVLVASVLSAGFLNAAPIKVGVLLKSKTPFWDAVEKGAREAESEFGAEVIVKSPMSESDVAIQVQLFNALVRQNVQAIVVAAINKDALATPASAAAAQGIKIVALDSPLSGDTAASTIGTDQHAAGAAAGQLMAALVQGTDEIALLKHNQNGGASELRETGAVEVLHQRCPNLVIHGDIYASSESGTEVQKAEVLLERYPNVKCVLASGTPGTLAMLKVIKSRKLDGKVKLVGFGFNLTKEVAAAIEQGQMQGWIAQLPRNAGYQSVSTAVALLRGEKPPANLKINFVVVTKENLQTPAVQALLVL